MRIELNVMTLVVAGMGLALLRSIGKGSPRRRFHGRFVRVGAVLGFLYGGIPGSFGLAGHSVHPHEVGGMAGFGLLIGWLAGTIVGALALWCKPCVPENQER